MSRNAYFLCKLDNTINRQKVIHIYALNEVFHIYYLNLCYNQDTFRKKNTEIHRLTQYCRFLILIIYMQSKQKIITVKEETNTLCQVKTLDEIFKLRDYVYIMCILCVPCCFVYDLSNLIIKFFFSESKNVALVFCSNQISFIHNLFNLNP